MKALFSTEGIIYRIMTIIYQLVILNLLWCVASIPVITIGASTTALFYVVGKIVRKEEVHEFRDYIKGFRDNFKQATIIWLILCAAYLMIFANFSFLEQYSRMGGLMLAIQLPVLVQVIIVTVFVFPLLSRYESRTIEIIKTSWILGIRHIFSCIASLAIIAVAVILAKLVPALFLMVFTSLAALAIYLVFNRILEKYRPGAA
ncbi:MAG TPA: YesL family protein [Clostridia bacterium]|nr:YesL family protein [Clostridia bacterium]